MTNMANKKNANIDKMAKQIEENLVFRFSITAWLVTLVTVIVSLLSTITALLVSVKIADDRNGTNWSKSVRGVIDETDN